MKTRKTIAIMATMDTKSEEVRFLRRLIEGRQTAVRVIDVSALRVSPPDVDVPRNAVAKAGGIGRRNIAKLDRGTALAVMQNGAREIVWKLFCEGKIDGLLALGGSGGSSIALPALNRLPVGFPKILISPMGVGGLQEKLEGTDVIFVNPVTDILGLNRVNRSIFENMAVALCAMVKKKEAIGTSKGTIGLSSFGVTTPAVMRAKALLEERGLETIVFPANGSGGRTLERLVREGAIQGVLDLTITELADEVAGGILSAGPDRLEAPGEMGIPHVIAPGAIDVINFRAGQTLPARLRRRHFYRHSAMTLLMRTSLPESRKLGELVARKLNKAKGRVAILIPLLGFSAYDKAGEVFYDPRADSAFLKALRKHLSPSVEILELDLHINDELFAEAASRKFLEYWQSESNHC